jgi:hypothetical protein
VNEEIIAVQYKKSDELCTKPEAALLQPWFRPTAKTHAAAMFPGGYDRAGHIAFAYFQSRRSRHASNKFE